MPNANDEDIPLQAGVRRLEKILLNLQVNKTVADAKFDAVKILTPWLDKSFKLNVGDTYHVTYTFNIAYLGQTVERLGAILELLGHPETILWGSHEELFYGRSLLLEIVKKIESIQQRGFR